MAASACRVGETLLSLPSSAHRANGSSTNPPHTHTHTAPSPFRIALWSFLPPHFRSSTTKPIPVPGVIYPFQPSTTCGRISQPANSQAFLNLQNKAKQNPAVLFSPHQMVFLQPTERCFPTVASRLSSQGVGSHPRRHIPSGGQNAPKPIQEPKLCPSKPKSRESQRGSAGKLLGDGGLGCWMPWARSTEHPEWGPRRIHPPPRGLQLPTERADYGESAPIDPLRRQRKYKGTKRDFSLVEDLGVLLCLEGGKKAEGGLHTMGRH